MVLVIMAWNMKNWPIRLTNFVNINGSITFSIGENIINTIFLLLGKIKRTFLSFYNTIKATKLY